MELVRTRAARLVGALLAAAWMGLSVAVTPAMGSAVSSIRVTIYTKSANPVVTGDVWTVYAAGKYSRATIHGRVFGAPNAAKVELKALAFPFNSVPKTVAHKVLSGADKYSFKVTPSFATRYWVAVVAPGSKSPLATSNKATVYVAVRYFALNGATSCNTKGNRPVCHQNFELGFHAPAKVLSREGHKHRYTYFGLALSPSEEPPPPKVLKLVKDFSYGSLVKVSSSEYKVSLHFSFEVGTDGYYFAFAVCTKNTESVDGIGLPGHHGCGGNQVLFNSRYLG